MKLIPPNITPGHWSSYNRLVESPHVFVARCHNLTDEERCGDTEANALAIAATPDTLAALASLVSRSRYFDQSATHEGMENCKALAAARAALIKAGYQIEG